jgi:hypothetical protein
MADQNSIMMNMLALISEHPGHTVGELTERYDFQPPKARNELAKRVSDLHRKGMISPAGERVCSTTGRLARTWKVSNLAILGDTALHRTTGERLRRNEAINNQAKSDLRLNGSLTTESLTGYEHRLINGLIDGCDRLINLRTSYLRFLVPPKLAMLAADVKLALLKVLEASCQKS